MKITKLILGLALAATLDVHADTSLTIGLDLSDSNKLTANKKLVDESNFNQYTENIAEYSAILARALSSVTLTATAAAQKAIDDNKPSFWKAHSDCPTSYRTTINPHSKNNSYEKTIYVSHPRTYSGSMASRINNYRGDLPANSTGCRINSVSFY